MASLRAPGVLLAGVLLSVPAYPITVFDDFESYVLGSFPATWSDVAAVDPVVPITPIPSVSVVATTDAFGMPTQAAAFADAFGSAGGLYRPVPLSSQYGIPRP